MDTTNLILSLSGHPDFQLREIGIQDIENLRTWKNENKNSFFLNQDITPEQQQNWFEKFVSRENDYMFIVEQKVGEDWEKIGCMGFRKLEQEGCIDAYNIIRSKKIEPASFTMSDVFLTMLAYAASLFPDLPIRCKVLSKNPAVEWYKKNSFSIVAPVENYYLMELSNDAIKNIDWSIKKTI